MDGPRYFIGPADALRDERVTDLHLRVLAEMGSHSDRNGWLTINQKTMATRAKRARETINRAIRDLVKWGYLRKRGRVGDDGRRLVNRYQVVNDRDEPSETAVHVTPTSQGVCDAHVTGYVTQLDHRVCDLAASQQVNDLFSERPLSKDNRRTRDLVPIENKVSTPRAALLTVLDEEHADAIIDHRQCLRKPLSTYAAKLLAQKLGGAEDANIAAETIIERGWIGFEPEWLAQRPGSAGQPKTLGEIAHELREALNIREDGRVIEHTD